MNVSAYLKSHGWRGEGFSLDTTDRGLARPLLVNHKIDLTGLGTKKNDFSNQWWLDSFNDSLKSIGAPTQTPRADVLVSNPTGLYSSFVKAATLESTMKPGKLAESSAMSMSTVPVGFVLGESPASSAFNTPIIITRDGRGTKRKHEEDIFAPVTSSVVRPARAKKGKKARKEGTKGDTLKQETLDDIKVEEITEREKEKVSKKRSRKENAEVGVVVADYAGLGESTEELGTVGKAPKANRNKKNKKDVDGEEVVDIEIHPVHKQETTNSRNAGLRTEHILAGSVLFDAVESAPGFISLESSPTNRKKAKTKEAMDKKGSSESIARVPSTKSDAERGFPDAKGIPTIHPKTGVPLSKKARKIIAKKQSKLARKSGRAEVRARRANKKAERAKQAAAKKKANGEIIPQQKEKKAEKYVRQKQLRIAKREAKAAFSSGVGTGANSMPVN